MSWRDDLTPYNNARNNKPDSRFVHSSYPNAPRVTRGVIHNLDIADANVRSTVEKKHTFHFLTNPWALSLGYNVNSAIDFTDPASAMQMSSAPSLRAGLLSVSFECLLDRTYEVWDGSMPEGVLHDIAQLEKVLGMPDQLVTGGVRDSWNSTDGAVSAAQHFPGVIIKRPVRVLFGGKGAYNFDGYVNSLSVELMKFNHRMAPTRAGISLSLESWGDPAGSTLQPGAIVPGTPVPSAGSGALDSWGRQIGNENDAAIPRRPGGHA